jgi:hypothetical protein
VQPFSPPPYPPRAQQHTPAGSTGVHWVVWLLGGGALLFAFALGLVFVLWRVLTPVHRPVTYVTYGGGGYTTSPHGVRSGSLSGSGSGSGGSGMGSATVEDEDLQVSPGPKLPAVKRQIPVHPMSVLDGCSKSDLDDVEDRIDGAIHVGAPLYNDGDFGGCYHAYESTAQSIEKTLPKSCKGPAKALEAGRDRASKLSTPAEQAWAMRDAFDGLLDVIDRKGPDL